VDVLFFCPTLADGGADRVVLTLLRHLDRRAITPTLVLMRREGALVPEIPPDVRVLSLDVPRLAVAAPALARMIRQLDPDVVFSTHGGPNVIVAIAHALAGTRARLVLSERSALVRGDRGRVRRVLEVPAKRLAYRRASLVTAVSEGVAAQLVSLVKVADDKVRVVYNPIVDATLDDLARQPVEHPWFHESVPILLAVGRLVDVKDYPTLLDAFAIIRARHAARLVILGDGPLRSLLEQRAAELGVDRDVCFLGFDSNPFRFMARATVLMHASKAEGLPGALIQAMACGVPVVATDCDFGPREVIRSGHDGFLVPVGNASQLASRVADLLVDRAMAGRIAREARASAQRYTVPASLARYEAALTGAAC
jgi:glycosyltransferase involved in cell wall biosynthesis